MSFIGKVDTPMLRSSIKLIALLLLFSLGIGSVGKAASFDCNKATTETEKAICSSVELLFSPNNKYVLTNFGQQCSAILYDLVKKEAVFRASGYSHKECFTFVGFTNLVWL